MKLKFVFIVMLLSIWSANSQKPKDEITQMLSLFFQNLNNLELEPFMDNFSSDASVFFPRNTFSIERVNGKDSIKMEFRDFFNTIRQNRQGPPYLNIVPADREIELYGPIAVVTLHFEMGEEFHRRTMILEKKGNRWLINHMHASYLIRKNNN